MGGRPAGGGGGGEGRGWLAAELAKERDLWLAPPELTERYIREKLIIERQRERKKNER